MSGLDVAAGAAGFVSLGVLLLQGCVKGFVLLSTAQNFGADADLVRCELEFQQYRLFRWADKVGLEGSSPNQNLNWEIINKLLKRLKSLMMETTRFKEKYGLELITTDDEMTSDDLETPKKGLRRLIARINPDFHYETARSLQKDNKIWKRLRWAMIDREGIALLINDIRRFIDNLYDLLQEDDQQYVRKGIEALLRHVVSQSTNLSELSDIEQLLNPKHSARSKFEDGAVKTAASLKQKRLMLGFGEEINPTSTGSARSSTTTLDASSNSKGKFQHSPQSSPGPRKPIPLRSSTPRGPLSYKLLDRAPASVQDFRRREMAKYDGRVVMVEWKSVDRGMESKLKHRIKTLAALLQEVDCETFHSLNCLGYLKDPNTKNYGYVFQPPLGPSQNCDFLSLDKILTLDTMVPSLNDRVSLAIILTETVLQLHTSGWLHKGIRSDNILLFQQNSEKTNLARSYLEGYEYARADNPSDMTEDPALQQDENLYRHHDLLRPDRASFCKAFDLYALGCVLIEIGLWENMTTILLHFLRQEKLVGRSSHTRLPPRNLTYESKAEMGQVNKAKGRLLSEMGMGSVREALEFSAGRVYTGVVDVCLSAAKDFKAESNDEDDEDDAEEFGDDRCIDLELDILQKLRGCRI